MKYEVTSESIFFLFCKPINIAIIISNLKYQENHIHSELMPKGIICQSTIRLNRDILLNNNTNLFISSCMRKDHYRSAVGCYGLR